MFVACVAISSASICFQGHRPAPAEVCNAGAAEDAASDDSSESCTVPASFGGSAWAANGPSTSGRSREPAGSSSRCSKRQSYQRGPARSHFSVGILGDSESDQSETCSVPTASGAFRGGELLASRLTGPALLRGVLVLLYDGRQAGLTTYVSRMRPF